jgi:translocation and assembly module TamB
VNAPRRARPEPKPRAGKRRLWRGLGIGLIALVVVLTLTALWALRTESGAGFVLARVQSALDGKLSVTRYSGSVAGPLQLDGIRYVDPAAGIDVKIDHANIDLAVMALFGGRVEISDLAANDVDVALTTMPPKPVDNSAFSLTAPIDIVVDQFALQHATIRQDGQAVLVVDRLDLIGGWTHDGLLVKKFALRSPNGSIDLNGTLGTINGYSGSGETRFAWRAGDTDFAGVIKSSSDGKLVRLDVNLSTPTTATLTATVGQTPSMPWNLVLDVPTFPSTAILADSTLGSLALHLQGSGDRAQGNLSGAAEVDAHRLSLDPLRFTLGDGVIGIDALHLTSPESDGALDINGTLNIATVPLGAKLEAKWQGIMLPADLVGQPLASHGAVTIDGTTDQFSAKGKLALGPPDALADIDLDLSGTPQAITLNTVRLVQAKGGLDANGTISLQPTLGWQIEATAKQLDPGAFLADWPGAIDFVLKTDGTQTAKGPTATLKLDQVGGSLRGRPLGGSADLSMQPGYVVDGTLALSSGGSRIDIKGSGGDRTDAKLRFNIATLGDWLPDASGTANGKFHIVGTWPNLDIDGDIAGRDLAWSGIRANSLEIVVKVSDLAKPAGAVTVKAENVSRGDAQFDSIVLEGDGNEASHQLSLDARGSPASLQLALSGGHENGQWKGTLKTLALDPIGRNLPDFDLDAPVHMSWDGKRFDVSESCLIGTTVVRNRDRAKPAATANTTVDESATVPADATVASTPAAGTGAAAESLDPDEPELPVRLCVGGNSGSDGSLAATYRLEHLPLRLLVRLGAPDSPVRLRGEINGAGEIGRKAGGPLSGNAHLLSNKGELFYSGDAKKPLLSYTGFTVEAALDDSASTVQIHAALDHDGQLDGKIRLGANANGSQDIDGNIKLDLNSLSSLELLSSEISNAQGHLSADYAIAGTLAEPRLDGALNLDGFALEVPSAGLKLHDGKISLRAANAQRYVLEGTISSGDGSLTINGEGGLGTEEPMTFTIKGEDFLAADIPAARAVISPDLTIERKAEGIFVTGKLLLPSATIDLAKLPGAGSSAASPDVVVVDAKQPEPGKAIPITARVTVSLGDKVKLAGYGFDGTLSGDLAVSERPGRATTGNGTLNAGGTYKAYGQNLKIETGRILFAGSAIDNPGIDIRATRTIKSDNVTAGLLVRGTAKVPILTVFGEPSMEQSEALSYLVTGKPLSSLKSGEGDMLGTAARALGTAGGDLLAKSVGSKIGVDDIGVSDNDALGGAAFTVGKYLSPKLYLSYGVGVFDPGQVVTLRYLFSRRWNFEAQNATTGSRAGINYRYEK